MSYTDEQWQQWCKTFEQPAQPAPAAPAQNVTNVYVFNVDNSINIQAVINPGGVPSQLVDNRRRLNGQLDKYLPGMYQSGNMDETAKRLGTGR